MFLTQVFKTHEGCAKRARFENEHRSAGRWRYTAARFVDGKPDRTPYDESIARQGRYTWRLERTSIVRGPVFER